MKQMIVSIALFLTIQANSYANNVRMMYSENTIAGTFKLVYDNDSFLQYIKLNNKTILKREISFLWIEKRFELEGHTIVIMGSDYSPNGRPSYQVFDIEKNGKVTYTKEITSMDYHFKAYKTDSKSIEIDLGLEEGKRNMFIYSKGILNKKELFLTSTNTEISKLYHHSPKRPIQYITIFSP